MRDRPGQHERAADDVLDRHEPLRGRVAVEAGVLRVEAVVAHHPEAVLRHRDVEGDARDRAAAGLQHDVRLVEGCAVDAHLPEGVAADDVVAGQADHAFDQVVVRVLVREADQREDPVPRRLHRVRRRGDLLALEPAARVLEDDDVAALQRHEAGHELVDEDPVAHLQRVLHGHGGDVEGPDQEGLDEEGGQHGHDHDDDEVPQERSGPPAGTASGAFRGVPRGALDHVGDDLPRLARAGRRPARASVRGRISRGVSPRASP